MLKHMPFANWFWLGIEFVFSHDIYISMLVKCVITRLSPQFHVMASQPTPEQYGLMKLRAYYPSVSLHKSL